MQPVFNHQRRDRRDLDHLMAHGFWINTVQKLTATAAGIGVVIHHLIYPPVPLRRSGGLNPSPSLEGGLEELRELRLTRSRSWASSLARAVS